jgi:L-threonylcarbamoyladenylate synthase
MNSAGPLRIAARLIQAGGVVAYPTESVFGLGCDPLEESAVERILLCKRRRANAGLIVLGADLQQIEPYISASSAQLDRMCATWPGPVTWVCDASPAVPAWITGGRKTLAVRITDHPVAAALCRLSGLAIVSTSANRSGRPPARSALQARLRMGEHVDYVLPGAPGGRARPSEIRDAESGETIRPG